MSRECNLDAVAARNVLKVALASKVMLEEAVNEEEECEYDPFSALKEMDDACLNDSAHLHAIPTDAVEASHMDRIIQCAEDGNCPIYELTDMIEGKRKLHVCTLTMGWVVGHRTSN